MQIICTLLFQIDSVLDAARRSDDGHGNAVWETVRGWIRSPLLLVPNNEWAVFYDLELPKTLEAMLRETVKARPSGRGRDSDAQSHLIIKIHAIIHPLEVGVTAYEKGTLHPKYSILQQSKLGTFFGATTA